jgi:hypothetical protein
MIIVPLPQLPLWHPRCGALYVIAFGRAMRLGL